MCGGSDPPEDHSVELRRMDIEEENRRSAEEEAKKAADLAAFQKRLSSAFGTAQEDAQGTLSSRGLDQGEYMPIIMRALMSAKGMVPELDASPGSYFGGVADSALNRERDTRRTNYTTGIDKFAPFGFAEQRIGNTMDDDIINGLIDTDLARATGEADKALERGSVTQTGYDAAIKNFLLQKSGINSNLQDTGGGLLEEGRNTLRNRANTGRQAASAYELGGSFDPIGISKLIDSDFTEFRSALSDRLKGKVGTNPLFDTTNLLNIAGKAQGSQNLPFIGDLATQKEDLANKKRGLAPTGAF